MIAQKHDGLRTHIVSMKPITFSERIFTLKPGIPGGPGGPGGQIAGHCWGQRCKNSANDTSFCSSFALPTPYQKITIKILKSARKPLTDRDRSRHFFVSLMNKSGENKKRKRRKKLTGGPSGPGGPGSPGRPSGP